MSELLIHSLGRVAKLTHSESNEEKNDNDWAAEFGLVPKNEDGMWHFDSLDEAKQVADGNIHRIWTIVQGDGIDGRDTEWILPGICIVNRISYLVSVKEWVEDDLSSKTYLWYEYFDSEDETDDDKKESV